jgi:3',5'-cyclic AMP phosphodiesterase CpdA
MVHKPVKRVLVIEDETSWQRLISDLLQEVAGLLGCAIEIEVVSRFADALDKIEEVFYDCVTVDNKLLDGRMAKVLLDRVASLEQRVPVVVVSGVVNPSEVRDFFQNYGIKDFFWKDDFKPEEFRQTFARLLVHIEEGDAETVAETLAWLHLSDFHFRAQEPWDRQVVLRHLLQDIEGRTSIDSALEKIDLVFITGDIGYSGHSGEYRMAGSFLKELRRAAGVRKGRMFIVPGNHDVNREALHVLASRDLLQDRDSVNRVYHDRKARRLFLRRFDNYRELVNNECNHIPLGEDSLHYVRYRTIGGKVVRITGLNSAWTSSEDGEYGKLVLGDAQVREALGTGPRKRVDVRILLFHHPLDWLQEFDRDDCEPLCHSGFDFVLHGHLHRAGILTLTAPDRQAIVLGAGACYLGRDKPNAYNFVHLDFENRRGVVHLREYTERAGGHWTVDTRTYREVPEGKYEFPLPESLCS